MSRGGISPGGIGRDGSLTLASDESAGVGNGAGGAVIAASLGCGATVTADGNGWSDGCDTAAGA